MKKLMALLFAVALSISLSSFAFAQDQGTADKSAPKKEEKADKKKAKKEKKEKKDKKDDMKKDDSSK